MPNDLLQDNSRALMTRFVSLSGFLAALVLYLALGGAASALGQVTIYSSIPSPLPGNVTSAGPEAYGYNELGDGLIFVPGTPRTLTTVTVILSSFACTSGFWSNPIGTPNPCVTTPGATFNQPIKLNIYAVSGSNQPAALLATVTQTFQIPYRPSSDAAHCAPGGVPGGDGEGWYSAADNACYHGLATPITFNLANLAVPLPDKIIVGVTFNTTSFGYAPLGKGTACFGTIPGCPYDSLNIGTEGSAIVGANIDPNGIYVNWTNPAFSCTGTTSGSLLLDTPCWTGLHPQIRVNATAAAALDNAGVYQLRYLANLPIGDSYVNLTNAGTLSGFDPAGRICVNVYVFDPAEEMVSCCACPVTPNGLNALSARNDLISNPLTPGVPTSLTVKLVSSTMQGTTCNASSINSTVLARGMRAWAGTPHLNTSTSKYQITETPFSNAELSFSELTKLTQFCGFIQANGSGFGICKSCRAGALGGAAR